MACTQGRRRAKEIYFLILHLSPLPSWPSFSQAAGNSGQGSARHSLWQKEAPASSQLGEVTSDAAGIHEAESAGPHTASQRLGAGVSQGPKAARRAR